MFPGSIFNFGPDLTPKMEVSANEFDQAIRLCAEIACQDTRCHNARNDNLSTRRCARCVLLDHLHAMKRHS